MSFARGERVYFDLDNGNVEPAGQESNDAAPPPPPPAIASAFVGDILERPAGQAPQPPVAPAFKANVNGFPAHKKRTPHVSAFRRERQAIGGVQPRTQTATQSQARPDDAGNQQPQPNGAGAEDDVEKRQIDEENRQKLANMSSEEIEDEQRELLESLPPSLIQRLLGRANLDDGSNEKDWDALEQPSQEQPGVPERKAKADAPKKVAFAEPDTQPMPPASSTPTPPEPITSTQSTPAPNLADDLAQDHGTIHFPRPQQPPDLDPNDPAFLENLHEKYFPNLAYDPSTLSWMTPIDPNDTRSPYHPSHQGFNPKDLRFDFRGALLAPSAAREIPVTQGLHHHADAPEAAGYTIAELAIMANSRVAAQRCIAFQTLGRFLYRLGRGEFGFERVRRKTDGPVQVATDPNKEEEDEVDEAEIEIDMEDAGSAMAAGLWREVEEGYVIETLRREAAREKGHLTSRVYAQEAIWNYERGGGRKRAAI